MLTIQELVAVACNRAGQAFLFNRGAHPILIFDPSGKLVDSIARFSTNNVIGDVATRIE